MRCFWLCVMLGACAANDEAPGGDADDSADAPIDDTGTGGTDDSGANGTDDSGTVVDTSADSIARGGEIVDAVCEHCHGPGNPLANRIAGLDDDDIAWVIENGSGYMPAQNLDPSEIADVIAYLRATFPH